MRRPVAPGFSTHRRWLSLLAVFLVVFGARLWLIERYGSPVPYLDQWDAEAQLVIGPWLNGESSFDKLFSAHNEHRVLNSRLLTLALFCGNGQWDPLLEAVASSFIYGVLAVVAAIGFSRLVEQRYRGAVLFGVVLMGALPFGWENTLVGFQSQFYLLMLFSIVALWGLGIQPPLSAGWWLGASSGMLACLSMGSGFFAAAAVLATMGSSAFQEPGGGLEPGQSGHGHRLRRIDSLWSVDAHGDPGARDVARAIRRCLSQGLRAMPRLAVVGISRGRAGDFRPHRPALGAAVPAW